jgi:hypothetical protein
MSFKVYNGPAPTAAAQQKVPVAAGIKTMLQLATPVTAKYIRLTSWGFSLDVVTAGQVELLQTDTAATVTAHVAAGIQNQDPNGSPSQLQLGAALTGYTATVENAPTVTRVFDAEQVATTSEATYTYQFMPDERPIVAVNKFLRVRSTFAATTSSMTCWIVFDEI